MILGALVKTLIFHLEIGPEAKNEGISGRDVKTSFLVKGRQKSNQ
jgi:hypothetical protein